MHFADLVRQFRQELQDVVDNSDIRHLKDRGLGVLVDGDDERIALNAGQMLERATDAAGQIDLGLDGFSGRADLAGFLQPLGVDHGSRAAHRPAQGVGQFLGDGDIVFFLDAAADGNQNVVLGDIDIACLGNDRLQIAPPRRQSADLG